MEAGEFGAHDGHDVDVGEFDPVNEQGEFAGSIDGPVAKERRAGRELDAEVNRRGQRTEVGGRRDAPDHIDAADHEAVARGHTRAERDEFFWHVSFGWRC